MAKVRVQLLKLFDHGSCGGGERHHVRRQGEKSEGFAVGLYQANWLQATAIFAVARPSPKAWGTWKSTETAVKGWGSVQLFWGTWQILADLRVSMNGLCP